LTFEKKFSIVADVVLQFRSHYSCHCWSFAKTLPTHILLWHYFYCLNYIRNYKIIGETS